MPVLSALESMHGNTFHSGLVGRSARDTGKASCYQLVEIHARFTKSNRIVGLVAGEPHILKPTLRDLDYRRGVVGAGASV